MVCRHSAVVGVPQYYRNAVAGGASASMHGYAIAYVRDSKGRWSRSGPLLNATDATPAARMGNSVAISGDGRVIVVGGKYDSSHGGAMWIYERSGNSWLPVGSKFTCPILTPTFFGKSVAVSRDGSRVGATCGNTGCPASIYKKVHGVWTIVGAPLSVATGVSLGVSSVFSKSGNIFFVTDITLAGFYVFKQNSSGLYQQFGNFNQASGVPSMGYGATCTDDGSVALFGGRNAIAYWTFDGIMYIQKQVISAPVSNSPRADFAFSPNSVALFMGGTRLIAGDPKANYINPNYYGAVYTFQLQNGVWTQTPGNLTSYDVQIGFNGYYRSEFGYAVSASEDGQTLLVGAYGDKAYAGSAFFFSQTDCRPVSSTDRATCAQLISKCQKRGFHLKWAGTGCRVKGKVTGDGGCQVRLYTFRLSFHPV